MMVMPAETMENAMTKFLALALFAVAATPAIATETSRSVAVRMDDLDLGKPAGIASLDRRLAQAARQVCADRGGRTLREAREAADCRAEALARVQPSRDAMVASARSTEVALVTTK
jgi:UrcA family protein